VNSNIDDILLSFAPVTLKEMEGVKLMDRTDTKFTFDISNLADVLNAVSSEYKCLHIENKVKSTYKTLYYDSADYMLYNKHHSGALNRYKIRHRTYLESNLGFLEVKFKNNKGRTIKERIKQKMVSEHLTDDGHRFLTKELPFNPSVLNPVVWINYKRITLVNKKTAERVTIDLDLQFVNSEKSVTLSQLVIAEVKQDKKIPSAFLDVMKKMRIREGSISKYCFAIAFTKAGVKKNNFKEKLFSLKHIINYDIIANSYRSSV
jgi:hypothetical protein